MVSQLRQEFQIMCYPIRTCCRWNDHMDSSYNLHAGCTKLRHRRFQTFNGPPLAIQPVVFHPSLCLTWESRLSMVAWEKECGLGRGSLARTLERKETWLCFPLFCIWKLSYGSCMATSPIKENQGLIDDCVLFHMKTDLSGLHVSALWLRKDQ